MTLMTVATTGLCSTHSVGKQTYAAPAPGTPHLSSPVILYHYYLCWGYSPDTLNDGSASD